MTETEQLSDRQKLDLSLRGHTTGLFLAGGRGGGKTVTFKRAIIAHCHERGADARPVVLRESHAGLIELIADLREMASSVWPVGVTSNKQEGTIHCPNGALIQFSNISDQDSYAKLQGRNFSMLAADEVGNYTSNGWAFVNRLRSNLRVPNGQKIQIVFAANPHGRNHSQLLKQFIGRAPAYTPFYDDYGTQWMWCHSTFRDNPFINHEDYERQLRASCAGDEKLANAWLDGDWTVLGGNMFDNFDPNVHILDHNKVPDGIDWKFRFGGDWGTASPSTAILLGQHPNGNIIALDEVDTCFDPSDLSVGDGSPPDALADMIKTMLRRNTGKTSTTGVMDDARGLQSETVIQLLRNEGLNVRKPHKKDRIGSWALLRQMLEAAKTGDGPALYFSTKCPHLIETLPEAPRGTLRPEDVDPRWAFDHHLDALAYGLRDLYPVWKIGSGRTSGIY